MPGSTASTDLADGSTPSERRYLRYRGILDPSKLKALHCGVIGVGAIGRQVAIQLASMGVGSLTIWDPDLVTDHNSGPQGYSPLDTGLAKILALANTLSHMNPDCNLSTFGKKWAPDDVDGVDVLFLCPDSITARRYAFENGSPTLAYIDGRMSAEALQVYCVPVGDETKEDRYLKTLFAAGEAHPEPCTARSTTYCAHFAASVMVAALSSLLRGYPTPFEWWGSVLSGELTPTY